MGFASEVSKRFLQGKRSEAFISFITVISILGVILSVVVLNLVLSIMTGFEKELQNKLVNSNAHILIRPAISNIPDSDYSNVQKQVMSVEGVVSAFPYSTEQVMITGAGRPQGILLKGIPNHPSALSKLDVNLGAAGDAKEMLFNNTPVEVERPDGKVTSVKLPPLVVGLALSRSLGISVGDILTLVAGEFDSGPGGLTPRMKRFVVEGIYHSGLQEYETGIAYTSTDAIQSIFDIANNSQSLEVTVENAFSAKEIALVINQKLQENGLAFHATDWSVPNKALWDALRLEKRVYYIVLLLLIMVASFSITSTVVMIVMEKTRDIALLKMMGASGRLIYSIFFKVGFYIGLTGTILGSIFGYFACLALEAFGFPIDATIFSMDTVPVEIVPFNFVLVAVSSLFITSVSGLYPARRASKVEPATALRMG